MKLARKLLCLLLALAMVLTLTPAVARAEEVVSEPETDQVEATVPTEEQDDEAPETGPVTVEIPFQVNPRYEGLITEADLDIPEFPEKDPEQIQPNAVTYQTIENAGKELRKQLKNRNETFTIYVKAESANAQAVSNDMLDIALEHTGVATEGDYIAWQFGGYGGQGTRSYNETTQLYEYTLEFAAAYYTTADQERKVTSAVYNLINSLNLWSKSDYDKIYAVYDWLCKNVTYDYENLNDNTYLLKHTAYAAIIDKTAVCQGYAVLFYRLMLELGVDARVIVGDGGGPHAWNIVELDGLYYNLDSTWDAGQSEYIWFLNSFWDFGGHEREMQYDTFEFHEAYPMAAESYEAGKAATRDPYINGGYCGASITNAIWLLGRDGSLTIQGTGNTYDFNTNDERPYYTYWIDGITKVTVEEGITGLGDYNFYLFRSLEEVSLPDSLTEIGTGSFYGCSGLTSIEIPAGVTTIYPSCFQFCSGLTEVIFHKGLMTIDKSAFEGCKALKTATLPEGLLYINQNAFKDCDVLTEVTIPEGVTEIGEGAWNSCDNLTTVSFPTTLKTINRDAFNECTLLTGVTFSEGLEIIGSSAFYGTSITELDIPSTVTEIHGNAFGACLGLTELYIPKSVQVLSGFKDCANLSELVLEEGLTHIYSEAFSGCTSLSEVKLPSTLKSIGMDAFMNCSSLKAIEFPEGLETIDWDAFSDCDLITEVTIPESVTYLCGFRYCSGLETVYLNNTGAVEGYAFYGCFNLKNVYIGENVTEINGAAFQYCTGLTEITVPETVTRVAGFSQCTALETVYLHNTGSITGYAFSGCTNLKNVEITNATYIGHQAFAGCDLESIVLPASIQRIDSYVFEGCDVLTEITFLGNCPEINSSAFTCYGGQITATAYYPAGNPSWTEDKLQNYGGIITWVPYEGGYEPTVKWSSISTSLGGNIAMNFYVELSEDLVSDPDAYIQFTFAGRTLKVALSEGKESQKNGVTVYQFSCPITSKNMTDEITAQIYDGDGKVGEPKSMSVDTYCNWVIANFKDEKTVNLMKAMLNYGASAQKLFNYRTDDLANATLAEADKVFGTVDASAYKHSVVGTEEGIITKSMTLLLDSETTVRVYFELTGDKSIEEYTFTVDGVEVTPTYKDGKYYIERPNISAHRLDDMHVFTCGGITVTYGGLSYVNQVMTYYTEGATFEMASALYAYSKAAEAYIG